MFVKLCKQYEVCIHKKALVLKRNISAFRNESSCSLKWQSLENITRSFLDFLLQSYSHWNVIYDLVFPELL